MIKIFVTIAVCMFVGNGAAWSFATYSTPRYMYQVECNSPDSFYVNQSGLPFNWLDEKPVRCFHYCPNINVPCPEMEKIR